MKKIGIIGGMGPESTVLFYKEIIKIFQKKYNAKFDSDFPEMFICNLPIPDIVQEVSRIETIKKMMCDTTKKLEDLDMDFISIPCNTINIFYDKYKKSVSIPVFNIIEETIKKVKSLGYNKIALLATETTYENKLYNKETSKYNLELINPSKKDKDSINKIIMRILNGKKLARDKKEIIKIILKLQKNGAEGIILGCTDLPIIIKQKDVNIKLFDTIKILAESTVLYAVKSDKETLINNKIPFNNIKRLI